MNTKLLYISGSYPANPEGIASGAKVLLDAFSRNIQEDNLILLTTNIPIITNYIKNNENVKYIVLDNWRVNKKNIKQFYHILTEHNIDVIHMEYPGDCYGKTFLASFLPLLVRIYNWKYKKNIQFNVRLHEFSKARFLRKIAIIPILLSAHNIYVPSLFDREMVKKIAGNKKIKSTIIGTNIEVSPIECDNHDYKVVSYFGGVYPGKGIEHMLRIWSLIHKRDIEGKIKFKIIGEVNPDNNNHFSSYHKEVVAWLKKYNIEKLVEITGYISDEEVSHEIQKSDVATLLYEDGLTLRRGSFLAYLAHGVPIVTTYADTESKELFGKSSGIAITSTDDEIINKVFEYCNISESKRLMIKEEDMISSRYFDWDNIAKTFLRDYGMVET